MGAFGHSSKVFGGGSRDGRMGQRMDRGSRPSLTMRISSSQSVTLQGLKEQWDLQEWGCAWWGGGSHQPPAHLEEEKVILVVVDVAAGVGELGAHLVQAFVGLRLRQRVGTQQHLEEFAIPGRESECGTNSWGCHCTQPWKWGAVRGWRAHQGAPRGPAAPAQSSLQVGAQSHALTPGSRLWSGIWPESSSPPSHALTPTHTLTSPRCSGQRSAPTAQR